MKIISWNINGLRAVMKKGLPEFLQIEQPDILCLQEIKVDDAKRVAEKFDFAGWDEYWHPAQRPGYSGTGIVTKLKPLSVSFGLDKDDSDDEGRVQTLELEKFYLLNIYFPNAQPELKRIDFKQEFNVRVLKYVKKLEAKKPVIICGDFNVAHQPMDIARPEANEGAPGYSAPERRGMDNFIKSGLVDTFRQLHPEEIKYSWWTYRFGARSRNVGWRIDYFLVSKKLLPRVKKAEILDNVLGSDHCPVTLVLG